MQDLGIITQGTLAVVKGKIVAVGKEKYVKEKVEINEDTKIIDATGKVVMPGFVDPHTHLVFAGTREEEFLLRLQGASYLEILNRGGGIINTVKATRKASFKEVLNFAKKSLDSMLIHGTTTVEAKSGYGLSVRDEIRLLSVIKRLNEEHIVDLAPTFLGAHAVPPEYKDDKRGYIELIIRKMLPEIAKGNLAEFCDTFCEKDVFSVEDSKKIFEQAKKYDLRPKIHADEISSLGGAELAAEIDAISADHLLKISPKGIDALASKGVVAVLLPGTAFTLKESYAPARDLIEAKVPVALATDYNPGTCMILSMQIIIGLACLEMGMSVAESLVAATINAACAIGREKLIGSLEKGKRADIIILDVSNHKQIPYRFGVNLVDKVIKGGQIVVGES